MQLKTILNRVERHKSFVYDQVRFSRDRSALEVTMHERANGRPVCSVCGLACPGYDRLPERRYEFVPLWALPVFLLYAPRRVHCRRCGVKVERVPWAEGKSRLTKTYQWFLASWAKLLSWQQVARVFRTSWQTVYRSVGMAVVWGLAHRNLDGITAIGVDEVQWRKGHRYLTLVYQIDGHCRRLLHIAPERTVRSLLSFFRMLGRVRSAALRFVCSDLWQPYLKVIAKKASAAVHVLDRFHIMAHMNKAIDEIRAAEAKRLKRDGYEHILKHSRWCLLKRRENLTEQQTVKLSEVLKYNLQTVRAYLHREEFQRFWEYRSVYWAAIFLKNWCSRVMRSRLEPMKKVARMPGACGFGPELVHGQGEDLGRDGGRSELQREIEYEKFVWLPHRRSSKNRVISPTWGLAGAGFHPQILVRRPKNKVFYRGDQCYQSYQCNPC